MLTAPSSLLPQRLGNALAVALVLALAWQLAWWTWHFLAPPSPVTSAAPAASGVNPETARRLFGEPEPVAGTNLGIRLKGVYAIDGRTLSAAVFNAGGKNDLAVRIGETIQTGVTLAEVFPDHVIVARAEARERIDLDKRIAMASVKSASPNAMTGFRLNVVSQGNNTYSLSRGELNTVLQDPRQLNFLGRIGTHPGGGVSMEQAPPGSLPDRLGLKEGDILRQVNGQPVNSPGDLARVYQQFGTLSQIRAEVVRGGSPRLLTFQIQP